MDSITTAVISAILVGATAGVTNLAKTTIADAYEALKNILKRKFGENSDVVKAVTSVEGKPDSVGRKETLKEEVAAAGADHDDEALAAALALLKEVKGSPVGRQVLQIVSGDQNVVIAGSSNKVNISRTPPS